MINNVRIILKVKFFILGETKEKVKTLSNNFEAVIILRKSFLAAKCKNKRKPKRKAETAFNFSKLVKAQWVKSLREKLLKVKVY
jgi:hypothetical protein